MYFCRVQHYKGFCVGCYVMVFNSNSIGVLMYLRLIPLWLFHFVCLGTGTFSCDFSISICRTACDRGYRLVFC